MHKIIIILIYLKDFKLTKFVPKIKIIIWIQEKQLYGYFKWQTKEIAHDITWIWLIKGNSKKKLNQLKPAQNKTIRSNHIKAKIDKMQRITSVG